MTLHIPFDNSYARLPDRFFARVAPAEVAEPRLIALNDALAADLGLDPEALKGPEGLAMLSGNAMPDGAEPIAMAYAGHQFGGWVPQLGDGRALLLGEVLDREGNRRDIQLKGSGRTPFSRGGDGRAWLGPVIREYLVSEAMHALGIPTTRALAAVATGEDVLRETALPGAVLTRVAASHVRVGTFQFFAARQDVEGLQALADHVIARHYPDAEGPLGLLDAVVAAQARLVADWLSVGFIHGVMNTDNCAISGETIDYGPCAFMDTYHPDKVFSSIDAHGRYAYARQPQILGWNLAQFATCLLPLMGEDRDAAIEAATASVHRFGPLFQEAWLTRFRAKLGLGSAEEGDAELISGLLDRMAQTGADFTLAFRALAEGRPALDGAAWDSWEPLWAERRERDALDAAEAEALMRRSSPAVIPRNHRIEEAIQAAVRGDMAPFERLRAALADPYAPDEWLAQPPRPEEVVARTFCGT